MAAPRVLESRMSDRPPFASSTVPRHLLRGLLGLVAIAAAALGYGAVGPVALLGLLVTVVAWRGCPACWTVGLVGTMVCRRR